METAHLFNSILLLKIKNQIRFHGLVKKIVNSYLYEFNFN